MAATIKEIANSAGVSIATVSNVLNGKQGEYSVGTRDRVIDAARLLSYRRQRVTRRIVHRESECLGVTFVDQNPSLGENYYLVEVLDGIVHEACKHGYNVSLRTRIRPGHEVEQIPDLLEKGVDALLVIAPHIDSPLVPLLAAAPLPMVFIGMESPYAGVNWIDVDNTEGARLAAEHLLANRHVRIAHVAGPPRQRAAQTRARVFHDAVTEGGSMCEIKYCSAFDRAEARAAACELLSRPARPTAIFAANDSMALGVMQAAAEMGIRVPDQLSVVGFDDVREATTSEPGLTTIRQPMRKIGERAAEWIIGRLKGSVTSMLGEYVAPQLVERGSTAGAVV